MGLQLRREADDTVLEALLPVPAQVPRFVRLPDGPKGQIRFLPLEALLEVFLGKLFPGYADARALRLPGAARQRPRGRGGGRGPGARVRDGAEAPAARRGDPADDDRRRAGGPARARSCRRSGVGDDEVIEIPGLIGIADLAELTRAGRPDLLWPPFTPRMPERVQDFEGDIFAAIRQKDMLLHHPYETFDIVVRFLNQAALDPDVLAIKQTLYRTSRDSPIVAALCEAAEAGKSVTALIELKARFDEAANIRQSRRLERAGAQVVYGFIDWKTHAKISTVVRREAGELVTYTHFGTGNYHPGHREHLHRPVALHLRQGAGARRDAGLQLRHRLRAARGAGEARDLAAHDQAAHPRGAGGRDRARAGRAAGAGLGQAQRHHRARGDRRALRREPGRGEDRHGGARHLRPARRGRRALARTSG